MQLGDAKRQVSAKAEELQREQQAAAALRAQVARLPDAGTAAPPAVQPPQQAAQQQPQQPPAAQSNSAQHAQQQQEHQSPPTQQPSRSPVRKRRQSEDAAGVSQPPAPPPAAPAVVQGLFTPASLAAVQATLNVPFSLTTHLWSICPHSFSTLLGCEPHDGAAPAELAAPQPHSLLLGGALTAPPARHPLAGAAAQFSAAFTRTLPRVASGMQPPAALLDDLAAFVAATCVDHHRAGQPASAEASDQQQQLSLAGAALEVMGQLVQQDAGCRHATLAASGLLQLPAPPPLSRITLRYSTEPPQALPGLLFPHQSAALPPPQLPQLHRILREHAGVFEGEETGVVALVTCAALSLGPLHCAARAGALALSTALTAGTEPGPQRAALLPLLTSGSLEIFLQHQELHLPAVQLLHLLLEDATLAAAVGASAAAAAAAARAEQAPPSTGGAAPGNKRRPSVDTPVTRSAARLAAESQDGEEEAVAMQVDGQEDARWMGGAAVLDGLVDCLRLPSRCDDPLDTAGGDEGAAAAGDGAHAQDLAGRKEGCALPRAAMAAVALLRERGQDACMAYVMQEPGGQGSTGQGSSSPLPVRLVQLAEAALSPTGPDAPVTPILTTDWPEGGWPGARAAQAAWQRRLRVAQEALTLVRGLLLGEGTAGAALDELLATAEVGREMVAAATRAANVASAAPRGSASQQLLPALPLAAWARAIGSSALAGSVTAAPGGDRAGLPCCSAGDVAYLAVRLRDRLGVAYGA